MSGCSGGGKSSLLAELARRGFATVPEPGRRIVQEELQGNGLALPWVDLAAFARRSIQVARHDREVLPAANNWIFFDRGLIDAMATLQYATGEPALSFLGPGDRYHHRVFLTPPWPEIYVKDEDRQHDLDDAIAEYGRLLDTYRELGYRTILLPKIGISERADFVLSQLR